MVGCKFEDMLIEIVDFAGNVVEILDIRQTNVTVELGKSHQCFLTLHENKVQPKY